jgi:mRNA-degrading endonuclease RelE of RelBE toxin-antitoxin system
MDEGRSVSWRVTFTKMSEKQALKLPGIVREKLNTLIGDIETQGPVRGNWKNYGKLSERQHHCHLKAGRPTYVVCYEVKDKEIKIVEIYYVGTHEKAPY